MPGKSRRARRFAQQQQRPANQPATAAQPTATAPSPKPAPRSSQPSKATLPHYPYVRTEMVRIGILTIAIIVILFVLAAVLPRA